MSMCSVGAGGWIAGTGSLLIIIETQPTSSSSWHRPTTHLLLVCSSCASSSAMSTTRCTTVVPPRLGWLWRYNNEGFRAVGQVPSTVTKCPYGEFLALSFIFLLMFGSYVLHEISVQFTVFILSLLTKYMHVKQPVSIQNKPAQKEINMAQWLTWWCASSVTPSL